jgi:hypothetical protein
MTSLSTSIRVLHVGVITCRLPNRLLVFLRNAELVGPIMPIYLVGWKLAIVDPRYFKHPFAFINNTYNQLNQPYKLSKNIENIFTFTWYICGWSRIALGIKAPKTT